VGKVQKCITAPPASSIARLGQLGRSVGSANGQTLAQGAKREYAKARESTQAYDDGQEAHP